MIYVTMKLYAVVRSRILIDILFYLGITLSYDRVCELIRELSDASLNQYNSNGVFTPSVTDESALEKWQTYPLTFKFRSSF